MTAPSTTRTTRCEAPPRRTRFQRDRLRIQRRLLSRGLLDDGRRLACDTGEWRHAFLAHPAFDGLRADWRATLQHILVAMASSAHTEACAVRSSREAIAERATTLSGRQVTVHQVKRAVRLFREHHLLTTLEEGQRASMRHPRNAVPLYALTVPVAAEAALPQRTPSGKGRSARARVTEHSRQVCRALGIEEPEDASAPQNRGSHHGGTGTPFIPQHGRRSRPGRTTRPPVTPPRPRRGKISPTAQARYAARLLASEVPKTMAMALLRPGQIAQLVAPFAAAGWSGADLDFALQHAPDGTPHRWSDRVRHPKQWVRWRLSLWLSPAGVPLPSRWEQLGGVPGAARGPHARLVPAARAAADLAGAQSADRPLARGHEESWEIEQLHGVPVGEDPNDAYRAARVTASAAVAASRARRTADDSGRLDVTLLREPEHVHLEWWSRVAGSMTPSEVLAEYGRRITRSSRRGPSVRRF